MSSNLSSGIYLSLVATLSSFLQAEEERFKGLQGKDFPCVVEGVTAIEEKRPRGCKSPWGSVDGAILSGAKRQFVLRHTALFVNNSNKKDELRMPGHILRKKSIAILWSIDLLIEVFMP